MTMKLKTLAIIFALTTILGTDALYSITITKDKVNVRMKPSRKGKIVTQFDAETPVEVVGIGKMETIKGVGKHPWIKVTIYYKDEIIEGWIYGAYLSTPKITDDNVILRSKPTTKGKVLARMKKGAKVTILKVKKGEKLPKYIGTNWYYIKYKNRRGWVFALYVK